MSKFVSIISLLALLLGAFGCSDDTATAENSNNANNRGPNNVRMVPDMSTQPCGGCFLDGECQSGQDDEACGAQGSQCTSCATGLACNDDGECVEPPACNPDNCDGCCTTDGQCLGGADANACGTGGNLCTMCAGSACIDGRCVAGCGPDNCAGCCNTNGECVMGDADEACGTAGSACLNCGIQGSVCGGGACIAQGCSQSCAGCCNGDTCVEMPDETACGSGGGACVACVQGQSCMNGVCEAVTGSAWDLYVLSADISFWDWDVFSNPDPLVYVYAEDTTLGVYWEYITPTRSETFSPVWDMLLAPGLTNEALAAGMILELYDEDFTGYEFICGFEIIPDAAAFSGNVVESVCGFDPVIKLRWRLEPSAP